MKSKTYVLVILALLLVSHVGCGRASHDLTLQITDEGGSAVPLAEVILDDDAENAQTASNSGEVVWTDLDADVITLTVQAEGFLSKAVRVSLQPGPNEARVALERAPVDPKSMGS